MLLPKFVPTFLLLTVVSYAAAKDFDIGQLFGQVTGPASGLLTKYIAGVSGNEDISGDVAGIINAIQSITGSLQDIPDSINGVVECIKKSGIKNFGIDIKTSLSDLYNSFLDLREDITSELKKQVGSIKDDFSGLIGGLDLSDFTGLFSGYFSDILDQLKNSDLGSLLLDFGGQFNLDGLKDLLGQFDYSSILDSLKGLGLGDLGFDFGGNGGGDFLKGLLAGKGGKGHIKDGGKIKGKGHLGGLNLGEIGLGGGKDKGKGHGILGGGLNLGEIGLGGGKDKGKGHGNGKGSLDLGSLGLGGGILGNAHLRGNGVAGGK